MDRRSFIACSLVGASAALSACQARPAPGSSDRAAGALATPALPPALESLLRDAARAPSSHNTQPWMLTLHSAQRWQLRLDPSRRLGVVDPHEREAWISVGAFGTTLEASAAARGLHLDFAGIDSADGSVDITTASATSDSAWLASLRSRRCLRRDLGAVAVDPALWQAAPDYASLRCQFLPFPDDAARLISQRTLEAESVQQGMDAVWQELADWIRWSAAAERRQPTGLTPAAMELPLAVRLWVAASYGREEVMAQDFRLRSLQQCRQYVGEGAGWLVIATTADDRAAWLSAGRCLQRAWLQATRLGLAVHPMSQALEVPALRSDLARHLGLGHLQLLLRIGKPPRLLAPVSPRLSPAQFANSLSVEGASS